MPCCPYCDTEFNDIRIETSKTIFKHVKTGYLFMTRHDTETFYCGNCKENFQIRSLQNYDSETIYTGFNFTCRELSVFYNYLESVIDINELKGKHIVAIPSFDPDFSDKDKLHEKLRTYIIFS